MQRSKRPYHYLHLPAVYRYYLYSWLCILYVVCCQQTGIAVAKTNDTSQTYQIPEQDQIMDLLHDGRRFFNINRDTALYLFRQAYHHSKTLAYYDGIFHAAISIAMLYTESGQYTHALHWFHISLNCTPNTSRFFRNSSRTLHNIGTLYMYQGQYKEAVSFFFKAAQLAEKQADRDYEVADHLVRTYNNISEALLQMGDYTRALYYLHKAEILAKKLNVPERMAHVLNNKARIAYRMGDKQKAWEYIHQTLTLVKSVGPSRLEYTATQTIAEMLNNQGHAEKAIPYLQTALKKMAQVNSYYRSGILYTLGSSYFLIGDYPAAGKWLEAAFQEATQSGATEYILRSHQQLAALYAITRNYQQAFRHQQTAYIINDCLLNIEKTQAINLLEVKYRTAEKDKEIIRKQLLISEQQNYLRQKNILIYSISGCTLLIILLALSYYRSSRHKQKINLLKAMIEGEERESTRIGQELHDGIGGRLAAINMNFGAVQKKYEHLDEHDELEHIIQMLEDATEEVRKTAHHLIPDILSRYSFPEAIRLYCEQVNTEELNVEISIQEPFPECSGKIVELSLYRIIQELIQNILKHAKASQAVIDISQHEKELSIVVEDNGQGFNIHAPHAGVGLYNIRSRVKLLQGNITIDSAKEVGTSVTIIFDISKLKTLLTHEYKDRHHR